LKKRFSPRRQSVDEHLKGLKVIHRHELAANLVGRTDAEILADEEKFLASSDGQNLNEGDRKSRQALVGRSPMDIPFTVTFRDGRLTRWRSRG